MHGRFTDREGAWLHNEFLVFFNLGSAAYSVHASGASCSFQQVFSVSKALMPGTA